MKGIDFSSMDSLISLSNSINELEKTLKNIDLSSKDKLSKFSNGILVLSLIDDKKLEDLIKLARNMGFIAVSIYTNGTFKINTSADTLFVSIDGLKKTNDIDQMVQLINIGMVRYIVKNIG
jgi:phosphosulfolactate synthase (CoM biosynthesis protein A)